MNAATKQISVTDLKSRLDAGEDIFILDIREGHELDIAAIGHTMHIPMGELSQRYQEIDNLYGTDKERDLVVMCRSGARSMRCVDFLRQQGYGKALNMEGGILAWADKVDNNVQKY